MKKFILVFVLLFCLSFVFANENISKQEQASKCLNQSVLVIGNLQENNFSVQRVNDSYKESLVIYSSQLIIESRQKDKGDFDSVIKKCNEISDLQQLAFDSRDSVESLMRFYSETILDGTDTSSADVIINEINLEMQNERYERISTLVDRAYSEISRLRTENTQLKLFYQSTARGFLSFLIKNKIVVISLILFVVFAFLVYRLAIYKIIIRKKIEKLTLRKQTLQGLVKKTQKGYFQDGNISEADYSIRIKNFAEMIRDIDRQIPLLNEQYAKITRMRDLKKQNKKDSSLKTEKDSKLDKKKKVVYNKIVKTKKQNKKVEKRKVNKSSKKLKKKGKR